MSKKIINLTPHQIIIFNERMQVIKIIESEGAARVSEQRKMSSEIDGIPLIYKTFGEVEGLPEAKEDVYYIVSNLVRTALPDRKDLLVPCNNIKDAKGNIIGCKALCTSY